MARRRESIMRRGVIALLPGVQPITSSPEVRARGHWSDRPPSAPPIGPAFPPPYFPSSAFSLSFFCFSFPPADVASRRSCTSFAAVVTSRVAPQVEPSAQSRVNYITIIIIIMLPAVMDDASKSANRSKGNFSIAAIMGHHVTRESSASPQPSGKFLRHFIFN